MSIVITNISDHAWRIRGYTHPYSELLLSLGAWFDDKALCWFYDGESLPDEIRNLVAQESDDVLALLTAPPPHPLVRGQSTLRRAIPAQTPTPAKPEKSTSKKSAFEPKSGVTPLRGQYLSLKRQYPDIVLLFQLGDFYEAFDEDAEILVRVCGLIMTARPVNRTERVPMAGFPVHALKTYLDKLVAEGYSVAIAEQVSNPDSIGTIERHVTKVVTPSAGNTVDDLEAHIHDDERDLPEDHIHDDEDQAGGGE